MTESVNYNYIIVTEYTKKSLVASDLQIVEIMLFSNNHKPGNLPLIITRHWLDS